MDERVVDPSGGIVQTGAAEGLSEYYIEAQTSLVERPLRTLKGGDGFVVLDAYGDLGTVPDSPEGLFFHDTRHLSRFELRFEGRRPLLLSSVIQDDNAALATASEPGSLKRQASGQAASIYDVCADAHLVLPPLKL